MGSTARRGALVPPGVPGVYRVPRVRTVTVQAADRGAPGTTNPWIQPPDDTTTPTLFYVLTSVEGDEVASIDFPVEAEAAMDLLRTDGGASMTANIGSRYDTETVTLDRPVAYLSHAVLAPGFSLPQIFIDPGDYPPGAVSVEYEDTQGTFLSAVLNADIGRTVSEGSVLLRVPDDEWSVTTNYGLGYFTPAELSTFDVLEDIPATSGGFTTSEPFDLDPNGGAVFVLAHDRQVSGTGWAPNDGGILTWDDEDTAVVITYRPPRYRFIYADGGAWTASIERNGYVWDAGEFLGSTFSDLTGFPTTCPASAGELSFYVVPGGFDFQGDSSNPSPSAFAANGPFGNVGPFATPGGATTPDAGSHLWVLWLGPDFDVTTDPAPDEAPAGLVPAALAVGGTG